MLIRLATILVLAAPTAALADGLRTAMIGSWSGGGLVKIKPTSTAKRTSCEAEFAAVSGFWLGGSLRCSKGRGQDLVQLRFAEPDRAGRMAVDMFDIDGDQLLSFEGRLSGRQLALYHPDRLEFGGTEYQPVMLFTVGNADTLQVHQLGIPTRSDAQRYTMSELLFDRAR